MDASIHRISRSGYTVDSMHMTKKISGFFNISQLAIVIFGLVIGDCISEPCYCSVTQNSV